jgi:hypothetical protein
MALYQCYEGETLKIGVEDVKDTTDAFVTALGGGESATYNLTKASDGTAISNGNLTYDTATDGTWRAFVNFPSTEGRVKVKRTIVVDSATRIWIDYVEVVSA